MVRNHQPGFSLIELLIVMGITVVLSTVLLFNFRASASNAAARHQISSLLVADLRRAQSMAASGTRYQGRVACGYGLHQLTSTSYVIYVNAPTGPSCDNNRNFQAGNDLVFETHTVSNANFTLNNFSDIFFAAPGPRLYLNNQTGSAASAVAIQIVKTGQTCPSPDCTQLTIDPAGRISLTN